MNSTGGLSIPFLLVESLAIIVYEYLTPWIKLLITQLSLIPSMIISLTSLPSSTCIRYNM